jgi:folate-binding protein YgfZ
MDAETNTFLPAQGALARLANLGILAVTGEDAASFLHSQLTNDIEGLGEDEARLAGYCSPKGRLLGIFLVWRVGNTYYLALRADLLAPLAKRLSMFVLRAKVVIANVSDRLLLYGLMGAQTARAADGFEAFFQAVAGVAPAEEAPAVGRYSHVAGPLASVLGVPGALGRSRWLLAVEGHALTRLDSAAQGLPRISSEVWSWLDIRAGVPQVAPPTQDRFVPQMINFEALGGVNFKKGCYPGQEVVARSQYLGKLKRRMTLGHVSEAEVPVAGSDVFHSLSGANAIGTVVAAEAAPEGGVDLLLEVPLETSAAGTLRLGDASGPQVSLLELPYPLPQNDVFVRPRL